MAGFQHARQSLHSLSCNGAGHVGPEVTTVEVLGHVSGAGISTIGAENRMTRVLGFNLRKVFTQASRVGIQCLTLGVNLQTANIVNKCSLSCTSPESGHLK